MKRSWFVLVAILVSGLCLGLGPVQAAAGGSISGRAYLASEDELGEPEFQGVQALILVVPVSRGTAIDLTEFAPGRRTDLVTAPTRVGPGLVKTDPDGYYSVTDLADGEYYVISADIGKANWQQEPPVKVTFRATVPETVPTDHVGYRVPVTTGRATTGVDFVIAGITKVDPLTGATTASVRVAPTTFDPKTLASIPDKILSVTITPMPPGIKQTRISDGEVLFEDLPPGRYIFTVRTATQGESIIAVFLTPSTKTATIGGHLRPPSTGDASLITSSAESGGRWVRAGLMLGAGVLLIALGLRGLVAGSRPGNLAR